MHISPYLNFDGQCKEAFEFYAEVLGGEIVFMSTFAEAPDDVDCSPGLKDKIMHAQLKVGEQIIMASDASPQNYDIPQGINITIGVDTPEEAERIYEALSEGGTVRMPMEETFWAKRFAVFSDRFGIPWMVNCDK
ncbi:VOC family protein [Microbulbifer halophilus]|uniref:VOC family protein n=1 Tax=Microbulbifer halophilus TaxID=453963 RepID=A0ABW5ECW3_9GAMM|nr:VOC family protein [Microbulbifer halophilus]MCW8126167.1 VOC family protein [Microbulbifer halophilus]